MYRQDPEPCDRETLLELLRDHLGFVNLGKNIRAALEGDLLAAVRRGILERQSQNGGEYHLLCRTIDDYRRDFLKDMFLQSLGSTWQTRDDAIRNAARHLGFARTGSRIKKAFKSIIRGLLQEGRLEAAGDEIRRKA